MAHCKREGHHQDEDPLAKKSKVSDSSVESDKEKINLGGHISVNDHPTLAETNAHKGSNDEQVDSRDHKDNHMHNLNLSSEDKALCNPEVLKPQVGKLFCIEADAAEDKGSRHAMEDAWVVLPDASLEFPGKLRCAHFAIYDGHGGRLAAEFAQKKLHTNVLSAGLPRELMDIKAAKRAILEGFQRTDESLLQESTKDFTKEKSKVDAGNWQDGATAVCLWILGQTVLVANIGDAKAVLARSSDGCQISSEAGSTLKAILLTREHKAIYPQERARIQKAGGTVGANGRLQGRLEVSRAFGDRHFKKILGEDAGRQTAGETNGIVPSQWDLQMLILVFFLFESPRMSTEASLVGVIATPDIHSFELTEKEQFVILGCDGLWGVFGSSDAVNFVQKQLKEKTSATTAARRLVREAVRERGCKDNCTAIVIVFRHN